MLNKTYMTFQNEKEAAEKKNAASEVVYKHDMAALVKKGWKYDGDPNSDCNQQFLLNCNADVSMQGKPLQAGRTLPCPPTWIYRVGLKPRCSVCFPKRVHADHATHGP